MEIGGGPKRNVWNGGNGTYKCGVEEVRDDLKQGGGNEYVAVEAIRGEIGWSS